MAGIPPFRPLSFWQREWVSQAAGAVISVAGAVGATFAVPKSAKLPLVLVASVIAIVAVFQVVLASRREAVVRRRLSPFDLKGCVSVLWQIIQLKANLVEPADGTLRITIHRVVPPPHEGQDVGELEQSIPYVGGDGSGEGRRFPIARGIIGLVARTREPQVAKLQGDDRDAFIREMVTDWGYTEAAAKNLKPDRRSWMAVPLFGRDKSELVGVVYLDSSKPDVFLDDEVRELVIQGSEGVAEYIRDRYS